MTGGGSAEREIGMTVLTIKHLQNQTKVPMGSEPERLTRAELLSALSVALDLTEGLPAGHSQRAAWMALRIADTIHLPEAQRCDLFYAVLLKDLGCSSNASRLFNLYGMDDIALKADFRQVDSGKLMQVLRFILTHTRPDAPLRTRLAQAVHIGLNSANLAKEIIEDRCQRGQDILAKMGFPSGVTNAIGSLDEHWDGKGLPQKLSGKDIPLLSRLALLAQVIDIFHVVGGPVMATGEVCDRSGIWFDPNLVRAFVSASSESDFWVSLENGDAVEWVRRFEEPTAGIIHDTEIDRLVGAFSDVIDAKSPWTAGHSRRVADTADAMASELNLPANQRLWIRRAALLHDIGKLGLSNTILENTERLSELEQRSYRQHVETGRRILSSIRGFAPLVPLMEAHHEHIDGSGFPCGLSGEQIPIGARIIAVADRFDWLLSGRDAMPSTHHAMRKIMEQRGSVFDDTCVDALASAVLAGKIHAPLPR